MPRRAILTCPRCGRIVERIRVVGEDDGVLVDGHKVWVKPGRDAPGRLYALALSTMPGLHEPTELSKWLGRGPERARGPFRVAHADTCGT